MDPEELINRLLRSSLRSYWSLTGQFNRLNYPNNLSSSFILDNLLGYYSLIICPVPGNRNVLRRSRLTRVGSVHYLLKVNIFEVFAIDLSKLLWNCPVRSLNWTDGVGV